MAKKVINTGRNLEKIQKKSIKIPLKREIPIKKHLSPTFSTELSVEKALVENFISLQKVLTNLSVSFDNLSNRISKLLDLFELSAKALAEKDFNLDKSAKSETEIKNKLNDLLDQNKIIARGLTLLHEGEDINYPIQQPIQPIQQPHQMPSQQPMQPPDQSLMTPKRLPSSPGQTKPLDNEEYKKSITSNE